MPTEGSEKKRPHLLLRCQGTQVQPCQRIETEKQKDTERKQKQQHRQCISLCSTPWDQCTRTLFVLKLTGLWPFQKKILNTYAPFTHPSLALFSLFPSSLSSLWFTSCGTSLRAAVTTESRGKKTAKKPPHRSAWSLIFDGQFPDEFPIAFHSRLVMCRM